MIPEQNTKATIFQFTGILYILWLSVKMDVSTSFQLVLSKMVSPCHITPPWIQGTCHPCSTAVDTSQIVSCWFSKISSSTCAVFTCPWYAGMKVQSSWWMSITFEVPAPFPYMMLSLYTITIHLHQLAVNLKGGNILSIQTVSHHKVVYMTGFPISLPMHINLFPKEHYWLTYTICCMLSPLHPRQNKRLVQHQNLHSWEHYLQNSFINKPLSGDKV